MAIDDLDSELEEFLNSAEHDYVAVPLATDSELVELLHKKAAMSQEQKDLKARLKELETETMKADEQIKATFEARGIKKMSLEGVGTFYTHTDFFPRVLDSPGLCDWLKNHGEGALVKETVNAQTLRAFWRGCIERGASQEAGTLPPANIAEAFEKRTIRLRKK